MRAAWALLAAIGCGGGSAAEGDRSATTDPEPTLPTPCGDPLSVAVGTGESAYLPLDPGEVVQMVHGPQGGWHLDTAGLVRGSTGQVSVLPRLVLDDGTAIAGDQQPQYLALVGFGPEACEGTFYGVRAFLDDRAGGTGGGSPLDLICPLAGRRATLTVAVGDLETGEEVEGSVELVLALDPRDVDACAGG